MNQDFLKDLNKEQVEAVKQKDGPMIILAGAGSGKTRVLTYKVINLIKDGEDPGNILMITFTNKAANEMKERMQKFFETGQILTALPTISTFHALCAKILRVDGERIGIPKNFVIYDEQDQKDAVKEAFNLLGISIKEYKPSSVLANISGAKNELINENEYPNFARGHFQDLVAKKHMFLSKALEGKCRFGFRRLDSKNSPELLRKEPEILEKYRNRFRYILVDEYQDTNHAQYILTKLLSGKWKNICVVGDFSQSIYSFRGADFLNLAKFKEDFTNVKTFSLSQNYRSTQKILDAASSVISRNNAHPVLKASQPDRIYIEDMALPLPVHSGYQTQPPVTLGFLLQAKRFVGREQFDSGKIGNITLIPRRKIAEYTAKAAHSNRTTQRTPILFFMLYKNDGCKILSQEHKEEVC